MKKSNICVLVLAALLFVVGYIGYQASSSHHAIVAQSESTIFDLDSVPITLG